ncbi:S9 family peptidase [Pedobacter cryophilus]|uniref:Acyl-peptide hydrolase n=1 Tax=Pedobacter cryophilus TaxID=2571271 RepID=A0A4U1BZI1_9SPHI|nr:S9 family peptidase [Pedobacter cryophilus]TKB97928.1 S9 family peptidase [Pedobacter cryophilus]
MKKSILFCSLIACLGVAQAQNAKRKLHPNDVYRLQSIANPQVSPEGKWVLYSVSTPDSAKNKKQSDLFMVSWDGKDNFQLTYSEEGEGAATFSPDGKYISYLSSKKVDSVENSQIWLMDRRGGEAKQFTKVKGDLQSYLWSPDGSKIALVIKDEDLAAKKKSPTKAPIVANRYNYKQDIQGYTDSRPTHLYVLDVVSQKLTQITTGNYDEGQPTWSPDCSKIAFVSNRTADPDRNDNDDIYVVEAKAGAQIQQLTTWKGRDSRPSWSKDGKYIAYLRSTSDETFINYDQNILAIMNPDGANSKLLTKELDRPVGNPKWDNDSKSIAFLVDDDRQSYISSVDLATGKITKVIDGERSFSGLESHSAGKWLTSMSDPQHPANLFTLTNGVLNQITHVNEKWLSGIDLATVTGFKSKSKDGTIVSGLLLKPSDAGIKKLPLILFIHGGPVSQDEFSFDLTRQVLAAGGYAVAAVNYRGSNGRGIAFSKAIYGDWGNLEVQDLLGATDYLVKQGLVDGDKLGIGGWSYGGILTDYTIATDTRFKAGISGAGSAMQLSMYGIDQYMLQWNEEIGYPWVKKDLERYMKISYPFTHADKIKTPTLFMVGQNDFNVPSEGSEQMYAALKTLNIPTELVIYPNQFHGIGILSYQADRLKRYLDWYAKYLK